MARVITLVLEASTYEGSAALLVDGVLRAERSVAMRGREHEALMPAVAALLEEQGVRPGSIGRVVCGEGPGSFTSLRIAGAIAKGIALAAGCPLVGVSSLALLVASIEPLRPGRFLAAIDALRDEHYVALFDVASNGAPTPLGPEGRIASAELADRAAKAEATLVGPGLGGEARVAPHARAAARLAGQLDVAPPVDLAMWEPAYGRLAEAQVKWEAIHGRALTLA